MKWLAMIIAVLCLTGPALAQEAKGDWQGTLDAPAGYGKPLMLVHLTTAPTGSLQGTLDSPDWRLFDLRLADVTMSGNALSFNVPEAFGRYEAKWDAAAKGWTGQWTQPLPNQPEKKLSFPLVLKRPPVRFPASPSTSPDK